MMYRFSCVAAFDGTFLGDGALLGFADVSPTRLIIFRPRTI